MEKVVLFIIRHWSISHAVPASQFSKEMLSNWNAAI
jgi:hypothetical protein